jgi:Spy/CpxP family protein refolding chaperone
MKKQILLMLVAVFAMNIAIVAQDQQKAGDKPQINAKARAEQMAKDLSLTDDQKQKVQALFEEQQTKMKEMKASAPTDQSARREEMKVLRKGWDEKLEGIIGKENMAKHRAMMVDKAKEAKGKKAKQ